MRGQGAGSTRATAGHLKNLQQLRSLTYEEACFYDNVGNFCCSNLGADWWEVARPCSVWGKFFSRKFKAELRQRVTDEAPDTSNGGGSLHGGQHQGGGVELFSSEGNSSCCKGGVVVEMSCSTKWRHPMGLPRAEPTTCRAQVL